MVVNRGGLLASTGATALAFARFMSFGRAPEGEGAGGGAGAGAGGGEAGGGAGAGGGEEDYFGGAPSSSGAGEGGQGGGSGEGGSGEGGKPGEGAGESVAEWMKSFSADKKDGELSHQEWLAKIGVKDLDSLAQIARDNQKALRESGRVKIPGEGATEAEIKAYREAVGAPEEAKGYEVALPEGAAEKFEVDSGFLDPFREIALKHNISAAAFKDLSTAFMAAQFQSTIDEAQNNNVSRDAVLKEWGTEAETGKAEFRRGLDVLGLKTGDVQRIQAGFGVKNTMELMRNIGRMAGEDFFAGNGGRPAERFGVANLEQATKALNAMIGDKETAAKIRARDPVTVQRYNALTDAVAHFKQRAAQAR